MLQIMKTFHKTGRNIVVILTFAFVLLACFPLQALADSKEKNVFIYLDFKEIHFDVEPVIEKGTTLVQFRPLFEKMNLKIEWDPDTQTITGTKDRFVLKVKINDTLAVVNDKEVTLPVAPKIIDGNTMVPIRFVAESLGRAVFFEPTYGPPQIYINRTIATDIYETLYSGGLQYAGETVNGKPQGKGTYTYNDELWYEGDFTQGRMEGKGKLYLNGKLVYEGDFKGDLPNGKGRLTPSYIYEGELKNGLRHGFGKLYAQDRLEYEGEFWENTLTGKGTIYETGGGKYVGDVKMGIREGYAQVYDIDGDLYYEGEYAGNHPAMTTQGQNYLAFYLYTKQDKKEKADKAFESFKQSVENKALPYKLAGKMFLKMDKPAQSIDYLTKGLSLDESDVEFHLLLALAYSRYGDDVKAEEHAAKAEEMGYENMKDLRDLMKSIKTAPLGTKP